MKRALAFLLAFMFVIAACGGGEEEPAPSSDEPAPAASDDAPQPAVTQPAVTIPPPGAPVNPAADDPDMVVDDDPDTGEGSNTEFCSFIADVDESQEELTVNDGDSFREAMEGTIEGMQRARALAPAEIADDVQFVLDRFLAFVELLEEYEYNFLALGSVAVDDPRLLDLESDEFEAALTRIGNFCGIDLITEDDVESVPPSGGGDAAGDLPAAFLPPGVVETVNLGSGVVLYSSNAPFADIVAFYTDVLGSPVFSDEAREAALFQGTYEGTLYSITMGRIEDTIEIAITPL